MRMGSICRGDEGKKFSLYEQLFRIVNAYAVFHLLILVGIFFKMRFLFSLVVLNEIPLPNGGFLSSSNIFGRVFVICDAVTV